MHVEHGVEFVPAQIGERLVAQDAGVVDHHVDPSEVGHGAVHDGGGRVGIRHRVAVGHGDATGGDDLVDHRPGGAGPGTVAVDVAPEVVHHHGGAQCRQQQGVFTAQTATGPGDHGDAICEIHHRGAPSLGAATIAGTR